jgi:hypothetical protein
MARFSNVDLDLDEVNNTELVALCEWAGFQASRAWPREVLLNALLKFEPPGVPEPLEKFRSSLSKWLTKYWKRIQMQAQKKVCPNCFLCGELQVLSCYAKNRKYFKGPQ